MSWGARKSDRVSFAKALTVYIMATDGSWRRTGTLLDISTTGARLSVAETIAGLNLNEFFLVLSASGRVFRRCGLIRADGEEMGVRFIKEEFGRAKKSGVAVS